jgi:hypothetical protein
VEVGAKPAKKSKAKVRLTRGRAVLASGSGPLSNIRLHSRGRLRHGLYMLKVTVPGAAADDQVISL